MQFFKKTRLMVPLLLLVATMAISACSYQDWQNYNTADDAGKQQISASAMPYFFSVFNKFLTGQQLTGAEMQRMTEFNDCRGVTPSSSCFPPNSTSESYGSTLIPFTPPAGCTVSYDPGCHCVRCH